MMFRGWENFYALIGSAAGALIGIMFLVATLTAGRDPTQVSRGARVYITPIVFHFAAVLVVSVVAEIPNLSIVAADIVLGMVAAAGFLYAAVTTVRIFSPGWRDGPDMWDKCFYGLFPVLTYLTLVGTTGFVWFAIEASVYAVGASMLVLLLIGITNAWDMATTLTQKRP
jgi:hypothetical protein